MTRSNERILNSRSAMDLIVKALGGMDLARLQMVNLAKKDALDDGDIWAACVKREMPQLVVSRILFEDSRRHVLMRSFACLQRTTISPTCSIYIKDLGDSQRLESCINTAVRCAELHLANGGNTAQVLVGQFGIARNGASDSFAFGGAGQPPLGGLPVGRLETKLSFDNVLRVGARYHPFAQAPGAGIINWSFVPFSLNVRSFSPVLELSFRGADFRMDGVLREATNGMSQLKVPGIEAVAQPLLCVLTLLDGAPPNLVPQVVPALNVDYPTQRS
eukprot:TRINITY_DN2630_c1_g1_i1.p1 TRINITY_DN2630_c1_g1~~TRINITY_DN2630_c1_g1_i1.p1  ORF type:complete len:275 (+),score=47.08 TRINITY_DN2630_c1_g1_i1:83-907(+)